MTTTPPPTEDPDPAPEPDPEPDNEDLSGPRSPDVEEPNDDDQPR